MDMRRGTFAISALIIATACSSSTTSGSAIVETDLPTVPARFGGTASVSRALNQLRLTIVNVRSGSSDCEPAELSAGSNVANLFALELRIDALSPSGDILSGTYSNVTAVFSVTDSSCTSTTGEVRGNAIVAIDASGNHISGTLRAQFPGSLFVVTYDALECGATSPTDAGSSCLVLPPCPNDGTGSLLCIDHP